MSIAFATPPGLQSLRLARKVHSLVRVSRREADVRKTHERVRSRSVRTRATTPPERPNSQGAFPGIRTHVGRPTAQH